MQKFIGLVMLLGLATTLMAIAQGPGFAVKSHSLRSVQIVPIETIDGIPPRNGNRSLHSVTEPQIVDTCTTFCDRCADKATSTCGSGGVQSYSCNCGDANRSCTVSCQSGKPPV